MKSETMDPIVIVTVIGSFIASISALILGLAGIIAQNKRDAKTAANEQEKANKQAELDKSRLDIDKDKATDEAYQGMLDSLRTEVARLHENETRDRARILELETKEIEKITQIGQLMLAKIDAESDAATMRYKMETMQMKLNALLPPEQVITKKKKEDTVPLRVKQTLIANAEKKIRITNDMNLELEQFKSGSIANEITNYPKGE